MGERIGNWGSNCSEIRIASHQEGDWYVNYQMSQTKILDLESAIKDIKTKVGTFNSDISTLKNYMQNTDFNRKNEDLTGALNDAISNVVNNFGNLKELLIGRLEAAAKTDTEFGDNAQRAADYIRNNSTL